jgi:hypothetical protein
MGDGRRGYKQASTSLRTMADSLWESPQLELESCKNQVSEREPRCACCSIGLANVMAGEAIQRNEGVISGRSGIQPKVALPSMLLLSTRINLATRSRALTSQSDLTSSISSTLLKQQLASGDDISIIE